MAEPSDSYLTIAAPTQAGMRERASKFIAFAWPVDDQAAAKAHLEALRKEYFDATHHCWAWRIGGVERSSDDGEPSGTAGKPILGQLIAAGLEEVMVVVVRYFGGTKLGTGGLIAAYRGAAGEVIAACRIVERTRDQELSIEFPYERLGAVMKVVKAMQPVVLEQQLDNVCRMKLRIRKGEVAQLKERLKIYELRSNSNS